MVNEIFLPAPTLESIRRPASPGPGSPTSAPEGSPLAAEAVRPGQFSSWGNSGSLLAAPKGYGTYPIKPTLQKPRRRPGWLQLRGYFDFPWLGHLNLLAVIVAVVGPLVLFTVVCGTLSFSLHHTHPEAVYAIVLAGLLAVLLLFALARDEARRRRAGDASAKVAWHGFLFAASLAAWQLGVCLGLVNFHVNMLPCYEISALKTYAGVDPAVHRAQEMLDAGRVSFAAGARLDLSRAAAVRSASTIYCVAPISDGGNASLAVYDFWVVGQDCCSDVAPGPSFRCGAALDVGAKGGIRITGRHDNYGLAIRQAETAHDLLALHPLLFRWTADPAAETAAQQSAGFRLYYLSVALFFGLELAVVGFGAVITAARAEQEQDC